MRDAEPRARVYVGDAEHIAEPDASFDVVVEYGILHHIPNWRGMTTRGLQAKGLDSSEEDDHHE